VKSLQPLRESCKEYDLLFNHHRISLPLGTPISLTLFHSLLILALGLLAGSAHAAQTMTLEQCLQKGQENNATLQASLFKAEAAGKDVKAARADFLPSLTSSYALNRIGSKSSEGPTEADYLNQEIHAANIKLTQTLYAGSRIVNAYDKAKLLELATQAEKELTRLELAYNIESTFYKVLKAKQDTIVAAEAVARLRESVRAAESFFAKELVPKVELLSARVDLADAENQLGVARNNENRQRVTLFALMNLSLDPQVDFVDDNPLTREAPPAFADCYQHALDHRPDLQSLQRQREAAAKQADIALGKYLPVVQVNAGYYDEDRDYSELASTGYTTYDRDQANTYWMVGLTVNWSLFDGGRSWYENEKYGLEGQRYAALIQEAYNTIATGIRKALYSMAEAEQRLAGSTDALAAARENYAAEDNRLKAGVSTITALLDAQSRLVRAQVNQANATLDYQLAQSELKFMTGGKKSW